MVLRLPVLGDLVRTAIIERVCRILSSMIRAGVALPDAMRGHRGVGEQRGLPGRALDRPGGDDRRAGPGRAPRSHRAVPGRRPPDVPRRRGDRDARRAARDRRVVLRQGARRKLKRFTSLFEPLVIIFMGVIVGFVAIALVSAMYGIYKQVKIQ